MGPFGRCFGHVAEESNLESVLLTELGSRAHLWPEGGRANLTRNPVKIGCDRKEGFPTETEVSHHHHGGWAGKNHETSGNATLSRSQLTAGEGNLSYDTLSCRGRGGGG